VELRWRSPEYTGGAERAERRVAVRPPFLAAPFRAPPFRAAAFFAAPFAAPPFRAPPCFAALRFVALLRVAARCLELAAASSSRSIIIFASCSAAAEAPSMYCAMDSSCSRFCVSSASTSDWRTERARAIAER
jgi:hypothetical protein